MSLPACYAVLYMSMAQEARALGYALALHGSLVRDLDLIAVPWTENAAPAEDLVAAMITASGGFTLNDETADPNDFTRRNPQPKPHGRRSWKIYLDGSGYIDLSVLPRLHSFVFSWGLGDE